jgi:hypothetical protein
VSFPLLHPRCRRCRKQKISCIMHNGCGEFVWHLIWPFFCGAPPPARPVLGDGIMSWFLLKRAKEKHDEPAFCGPRPNDKFKILSRVVLKTFPGFSSDSDRSWHALACHFWLFHRQSWSQSFSLSSTSIERKSKLQNLSTYCGIAERMKVLLQREKKTFTWCSSA